MDAAAVWRDLTISFSRRDGNNGPRFYLFLFLSLSLCLSLLLPLCLRVPW